MDPKALSKLCNSGGELPQLSNSCQQHSATGDRTKGRRQGLHGIPAAFRIVECNSPKQNLAQTGSHLLFIEMQQKCILIPKWSTNFSFLHKIPVNGINTSPLPKNISFNLRLRSLILVVASLIVDQGTVVSDRTSFLFSPIKRSINNCGVELNQAVWNLMCSNSLCFFFFSSKFEFLRESLL